MTGRPFALFVAFSCIVACSLAAAQPPEEEAGKKPAPRKTSYVSVAKQRNGSPVLVIEYPWKPYTKASIEIRLTKGSGAKPDDRAPLLFQKTRMKGKNADTVYQCLDRSAEQDTTKPLTIEGADYDVIGYRNALQKPSVCVVSRPEPEGDEPPTEVAAALLMLESWAVNGKMLYVDLPPDAFADAGSLQIWFLRDDLVLWQESVAWPSSGKQPAANKKPAGKKPTGKPSKPAAAADKKPASKPAADE